MSTNRFELKLAGYIQEKNGITLAKLGQHFLRSPSSLRRNLANINRYLPEERQFCIEKEAIANQLTYTDYIHFISGLSLCDYAPSQPERISLMLAHAFFDLSLNMRALYDTLDLSPTTKKKDSRQLSDLLESHALSTQILPGKGIRVLGDEIAFRVLLVSIISGLLEINAEDDLCGRLANTPIERMLFDYFSEICAPEIRTAKPLLLSFLSTNQLRLSYPCKKFLYIYLAIAAYRTQRQLIVTTPPEIPLQIPLCPLLTDENENQFLGCLIVSLDYNVKLDLPRDEQLTEITQTFITAVQENIITKFHHPDTVFTEIYDYLYKSILRNKYNYHFYDNKLEDTKQQIAKLYGIIARAAQPMEKAYGQKLSSLQISTLTLIFKRLINENKVIGRNSKRIVVVTNSATEKVAFFIASMKRYVDIKLIDSIHINELYRLDDLSYDVLITFSNRISTLLLQNNYQPLKLNFYLTREDTDKLFALGFSSSKRKLIADKLINEIAGMTRAETKSFLLRSYPDYFL